MAFQQHWLRLWGLPANVSLHISVKSVHSTITSSMPVQKHEQAYCTVPAAVTTQVNFTAFEPLSFSHQSTVELNVQSVRGVLIAKCWPHMTWAQMPEQQVPNSWLDHLLHVISPVLPDSDPAHFHSFCTAIVKWKLKFAKKKEKKNTTHAQNQPEWGTGTPAKFARQKQVEALLWWDTTTARLLICEVLVCEVLT